MLTLTAQQLFTSFQSCAALSAQRISNPRLAYNLAKTWKAFQDEVTALKTQETEIYKSFGATEIRLDNGATALSVDMEKLSAEEKASFESQVDELMKISVEIWGTPIKLSELDAAKVELSANDFVALDWLITDETDNAAPAEKANAQGA